MGKSFKKSVLKVTLAAVVYGIWWERNSRIFQQKRSEPDVSGSKVCNNIRDAIVAWRNVSSTQENRVLCRNLGIPLRILRSAAAIV